MPIADFCTLAEARAYINPNRTDPGAGADDTPLALAITAASDNIRNASNRDFNVQDAVATTRYFTPQKPGDTRAFSSFPWNPGAWGFLPYFFYPIPSTPDRILPIDDVFLTNQVIGDLVFTNFATSAVLTLDRLWPFNAAARGEPYTAALFAPGTIIPDGEGAIALLAKFGYVTVPTTIKQACLLQVSRYLKRRDFPYGMAGLDPDIDMMLQNYRYWWAAA